MSSKTIQIYINQTHSCGQMIETKLTFADDDLFQFALFRGETKAVPYSPESALVSLPFAHGISLNICGTLKSVKIDCFQGALCPKCGGNILTDQTLYPVQDLQIIWQGKDPTLERIIRDVQRATGHKPSEQVIREMPVQYEPMKDLIALQQVIQDTEEGE